MLQPAELLKAYSVHRRCGHITRKTVLERRDRLQEIITAENGIQVGGYVENRGKAPFRLAKEKGLEGIIAKRKSSIYRPGKRSPDWLKIKSRPQQEFIVCGFTEGKGSRKHFGALLLGAYRNGRLRYFGHSGTGFGEKGLASRRPDSISLTFGIYGGDNSSGKSPTPRMGTARSFSARGAGRLRLATMRP